MNFPLKLSVCITRTGRDGTLNELPGGGQMVEEDYLGLAHGNTGWG